MFHLLVAATFAIPQNRGISCSPQSGSTVCVGSGVTCTYIDGPPTCTAPYKLKNYKDCTSKIGCGTDFVCKQACIIDTLEGDRGADKDLAKDIIKAKKDQNGENENGNDNENDNDKESDNDNDDD